MVSIRPEKALAKYSNVPKTKIAKGIANTMATLNTEGNVTAHCPGCKGSLSTFEWRSEHSEIGAVIRHLTPMTLLSYRLYRCAGCGRGGLGTVEHNGKYPGSHQKLISFFPEVKQRLQLPHGVPQGIAEEFLEGEKCLESNCIRAAAGMFRSVLDKTLRANGYKDKKGTTLEQQIDAAANDGVITQSRRRRAHDEIRVLGNDVLHDEWQVIPIEDVEASRHYCQRVLEDFYDDRPSVLPLLRSAGRVPDEDRNLP